jgi:RNA polymerase-interacting CarD/CdnL/TRCF family regulator
MSAGVPMDEAVAREVREVVEHAAGAEVVRGIRESDRRVREMWARMSDEEIVEWILQGAEI